MYKWLSKIALILLLSTNAYASPHNTTKDLYPIGKLIHRGWLEVANHVSIYYEQRGNPNGPAIVYQHGGPGGHSSPENSQWFDPAYYQIILYDQRGTGKSRPSIDDTHVRADTFKDVSIDDMIADLEKLREHLHIPHWVVFGGSWGSTLSLAYSEAHPDKVDGLIVFGIFLNHPEEMDEYYNINRMRARFPKLGEKAYMILHHYAQTRGYVIDPDNAKEFVDAYYQLCVIKDDWIAQYLWSAYENFNDEPTEASLEKLHHIPGGVISSYRSHAVFETSIFRYAYQGFDVLGPSLLAKLKSINIRIIQGLEDTEAPPIFAKKLVDSLLVYKPDLYYEFVADGKHDGNSSSVMTEALLASTDYFKDAHANISHQRH